MRLRICAVGRLRTVPERALTEDYLARFDRTGRSIGLGPSDVAEVEDRKHGGRFAEAGLLRRAIPAGAVVVALDERGKTMSSPEFATQIGKWRDAGSRALAFLIGGPEGIEPDLRESADMVLSFGPMVWPHMLARAMLTEQLYRAASILAGAPYHRE